MRRRVALLALTVALLGTPASARGGWGLAAEAGGTIWLPEGGAASVHADAGGTSGSLYPIPQPRPGLKFLGQVGPRADLIWLSLGYEYTHQEGSASHAYCAQLGYGYRFGRASRSEFELAPALGLVHRANEYVSLTAPTVGAGLGWRRWFAHRVGALRAEVRYDRQGACVVDGVDLVPAASVISVRFGFELWSNPR